MKFAIERRAGGFNIGNIEELPICATRKARTDRLAHDGTRPVTAGDVDRLAGFLLALWAAKAGNHALVDLR